MQAKETVTMPKTEYVIEPGKQELTSTVVLDAPRELVFRAYTDPKLFAQWWGPRRYENKIEKFDSRPGGEWRVVQRGDDGSEFGFRGVNHDVVAPERICATFEFEGVPGHVLLQTVNFEPLGQKTRLVEQLVFQSVEDDPARVRAQEVGRSHPSDAPDSTLGARHHPVRTGAR
ncbi:MAG: ATPase [Chloroflexi bacterium]|nr:MAG: ATPase [Chloroflexota bacterium]